MTGQNPLVDKIVGYIDEYHWSDADLMNTLTLGDKQATNEAKNIIRDARAKIMARDAQTAAPANGHSKPEETAAAIELMKDEPVASVAAPATTVPAPSVSINNLPGVDVTATNEPVASDEIEEGASDEEILHVAIEHLKAGKTDSEVKAILLDEFADLENDVDDFIKQAHAGLSNLLTEQEKEIEAAQASEDSAIKSAQDAHDKVEEVEFERKRLWLENWCLKNNKKMPTERTEIEKYEKYFRELQEKDAEPEETFEEQSEEPFPECPIFPGALTDLARALYPSLPLELKQWALITRWGLLRSGIDTLGFEPHLQPRFYTVFVAPPNTGKTGSINESRNAMKQISQILRDAVGKANNSASTPYVCAEVENLPSADSGPFLVQEFYDRAKKAAERYSASLCLDKAAKILLDPDELSDVFEKARTSNGRVSTLFIELLKLHSGNRTGSGTRQTGYRPVDNAHLAILAGTTVKKYPMLWMGTGGGADGLVSRFLTIATNAGQGPAVPLQTDAIAAQKAYDRLVRLAQLPPQTIQLSPEASEMLTAWWQDLDRTKPSVARMLDTAKQLLIVLAVVNAPEGHTGTTLTVGCDLVQHVIDFGNYEIALRERLNPGDSWTHVQAMEEAIIRWMRKHASKKAPKSRNDCRRGIQPQRMPGGLGVFLFAWKNCIQAEVLKRRDSPGITSNRDRYSL